MSAELVEWLNILAERAKFLPERFVGHVESNLFYRNAAAALEQAEAEVVRLRGVIAEAAAAFKYMPILHASSKEVSFELTLLGSDYQAALRILTQATVTETTKEQS